MRRPANPYRVLAHAIDVGDRRLAALLLDRLGGGAGRRATAIRRAIRRLIAELGLD